MSPQGKYGKIFYRIWRIIYAVFSLIFLTLAIICFATDSWLAGTASLLIVGFIACIWVADFMAHVRRKPSTARLVGVIGVIMCVIAICLLLVVALVP